MDFSLTTLIKPNARDPQVILEVLVSALRQGGKWHEEIKKEAKLFLFTNEVIPLTQDSLFTSSKTATGGTAIVTPKVTGEEIPPEKFFCSTSL